MYYREIVLKVIDNLCVNVLFNINTVAIEILYLLW